MSVCLGVQNSIKYSIFSLCTCTLLLSEVIQYLLTFKQVLKCFPQRSLIVSCFVTLMLQVATSPQVSFTHGCEDNCFSSMSVLPTELGDPVTEGKAIRITGILILS